MTENIQQVVNWLALGGIYALLALGIAVVFSVLGLINFAHGELVTITGYAMVAFLGWGLPWTIVLVLAILVTAIAAVAMERIAFRPVRGAAPSTMLLTSFALSLLISNALLLFVGARPKGIDFPGWMRDAFSIGGVRIQVVDVVTFGTTFLVLAGLLIFLKRSVLGLALRAAAEDFDVTRLMGLSAQRVITGAFLISGLLAGVAAFFYLSQTALVAPTTGFTPLLAGFIAAIIGGLGSLSGAVIGGYVLAGLEVLFQVVLPTDLLPYSSAAVFVVVLAVLLIRPRGLHAEAGAGIERV